VRLLDAARQRRNKFGGYSRKAAEAEELQVEVTSVGATPIDCCERGDVVSACGVLSSVTVRPLAGVPAVEADLYDGSGHLRLVWLGRRHILGIEAGRTVTVHGRMTCNGDTSTLFNPRYELRPRGET
jgi:hypothetical protein